MILPEYVTAKKVGRVCAEIGLDDWSKRKEALVSIVSYNSAEAFLFDFVLITTESVNRRIQKIMLDYKK